jgi:hypothetical protein
VVSVFSVVDLTSLRAGEDYERVPELCWFC